MKSVIFSLKRGGVFSRRRFPSAAELRFTWKRYGVTLIFVLLLLLGIALGAVYAGGADKAFMKTLDFLFTTNLDARLSRGAIATFCACFASDFIFLTSVYLLGVSPWGLPFELFVILFKGFGTGLTAAYLVSAHSLSGLGFYLLVLLPGTFLFCLALLSLSAQAFDFSKLLLLRLIRAELPEEPLRPLWLKFSTRFLTSLLMTFFAAALDAVLWSMFAGAFSL